MSVSAKTNDSIESCRLGSLKLTLLSEAKLGEATRESQRRSRGEGKHAYPDSVIACSIHEVNICHPRSYRAVPFDCQLGAELASPPRLLTCHLRSPVNRHW